MGDLAEVSDFEVVSRTGLRCDRQRGVYLDCSRVIVGVFVVSDARASYADACVAEQPRKLLIQPLDHRRDELRLVAGSRAGELGDPNVLHSLDYDGSGLAGLALDRQQP